MFPMRILFTITFLYAIEANFLHSQTVSVTGSPSLTTGGTVSYPGYFGLNETNYPPTIITDSSGNSYGLWFSSFSSVYSKSTVYLFATHSMKLKNDGSYQFSGTVKVQIGDELFEYPSLSLFFSRGIHDYSLEKQSGRNILKIFESFHSIESEVLSKP